MRYPTFLLIAMVATGLLVPASRVGAGGSVVPVGTYLYAQDEALKEFNGSLNVTFDTPGKRMVLAYGHKNRKDRKDRDGTTETEREKFKPILARMAEGGREAHFDHLPPDFYDIVVIDPENMRLYEGLRLYPAHRDDLPKEEAAGYFDEVKRSLSVATDRVGGWESFFDTKDFIRLESDGVRGCMLIQQMRLGQALAESGAVLQGCIHSIDLCWVERTRAEGNLWQVVTRQQLYRDEIPSRELFKHRFLPELQGIRIGVRDRELGPVHLPTD